MSNSLYISDGSTTIYLSSSNCVLVNFAPAAAVYDDAGKPATVTDNVEFVILESTTALAQAKLNAIGQLLAVSKASKGDRAPDVYLYFKTGADAAYWHSKLLDYRLELLEESVFGVYDGHLSCRLIVEREAFWEGALTEVAISAKSFVGVPITGGVTIKNFNDATYGNWVQIEANGLVGDLPSPAYIKLTNSTGAARTYRMYISHNVFSSPASLTAYLEAEARSSGGAATVNAASSGGYDLQFVLADSSITFHWVLSSGLLASTRGRFFQLLGMFTQATGSPVGTAQVSLVSSSTTTPVWKSDVVPLPTAAGIVNFGAVPFPPGGYSTVYGAMRLQITFTGTGTWSFDYLQLAGLDSFALLTCLNSVAASAVLVADFAQERDFILASSLEYPFVTRAGGGIFLLPGFQQRLYFNHSSSEAGPKGTDQSSVRLYYYPRRSTF